MAENPPLASPVAAPAPAVAPTLVSPTPTAPADAAAAAVPVQPGAGASIGNPRDIQGIIGLVFVGGSLAVAGVAIATGTSALIVLSAILPLTGNIIGYYFGVKSQQ